VVVDWSLLGYPIASFRTLILNYFSSSGTHKLLHGSTCHNRSSRYAFEIIIEQVCPG
jgi:hypothetical protein